MGETDGIVHQVSAVGIAASHPELKPLPIFVGPSVGEEFNTVRSFLVPSACFRLEDTFFAFDSSFIRDFDAGPLKTLLDIHPGSKLSIFGHTDPVGQDEFNKVLSGRRAQSVLGLLLRDIALWEDLYRHHDTQGKDPWGVKSVQLMLNKLKLLTGREDGVLDEPTKEQLTQFETTRGLALSGFDSKQEIAKPAFTQLATEYMDVICSGKDNKPFTRTREDFLARGKGKDGKGDIQGCGEFNPNLLFSKADKARLDQKENQPERDKKNRLNRRVMILLFKPGSEIDPTKWPCPTVKEGVAGCKARFFSDGEKRRENTAEEREFSKTNDTFACRFYQRLLEASPCEETGKFDFGLIFVQLFDGDGRDLLKKQRYRIESESGLKTKFVGETDDQGRLRHENVPPGEWVLTVEGLSEKSVVHVLSPEDTRPQVRCLENPRLRVVVTTPDGEPIEGATVEVTELGTKKKTDSDGVADFGSVKPGDFTFRASNDGFSAPPPAVRSSFVAAPGGGSGTVGDAPGASGKVAVKDTRATGKANLAPAAGPVRKINAIQPGTASLRNDKVKLDPSEPLSSSSADPDFAKDKNPPFVLIRGSDPVTLVAETSPPDQKVKWSVDPARGNTEARPGITVNDDGSATLATDKTGAFAVTASIGASKMIWNVVFVFVDVKVSSTLAFDNQNGAHFEDNGSTASDVKFRSGKFEIANPGQFAFNVLVDVRLDAGPNADPALINDVAIFFLQNGTADDLRSEYTDGSVIREVFKDPAMKFPVVDSNGKTADYFGPLCLTEPPFTIAALQTKVVRDDGDFKVLLFGDSPDGSFPARTLKGVVDHIRGQNDFKLAVASICRSSRNCVVVHAELTWTANFDGRVEGAKDGKTKYVREGAFSKITTPDRKFQPVSPATGGQNARDAKYELFAPKFTDAIIRR